MLFAAQLPQVSKCVEKTMWRKPAFSDMFENNAFSYGVWGIMGACADFAGIVYRLLHPSFGIALA